VLTLPVLVLAAVVLPVLVLAVLPLPAYVHLALFLVHTAPDPVSLVRRQRVLQALPSHPAGGADRLRLCDLPGARPYGRDREEHLRIRLLAGGRPPPVVPFLLNRGTLGWQLGNNNHAQTPESFLSQSPWLLSVAHR
jgi:hypothetical protein